MDTKNWKEFKVGDLFNHIGKTAIIDPASKRKCKDEIYNIPALSSTVINNSFGYYANPKEHNIINRRCLSVTSNGDAGKVYLQNQPFVIAQDAYVIYLKDDDRENVYLFMACALEKLLMPKYSYTNKAGWNKVKKEIIELPAKNDKPDFDYMEEYIEEIKLKYVDKLEKDNNENIDKALKVTGLSYVDLNKDLTVKSTDRYEEFRVGDLFNHIGKTAVVDPASKREYKDETYNVPALSSTVTNNSFGYYANPEEHNIIDKVCLSVTSNGHAGKVYLQNQPFVIAQDAYVIYLKNDNRLNVHLFIACVLEKLLMPKYNYNNKAVWNKVKNEKITLPAIDENTPDFDYMEKAIYIYTAKKIKLEKLFNEKKIKLVRRLINE